VVIFFINGINALLGWNAVLASLDYFAGSFTDYNIYSFLPVPLFVGYITIGVIYHSVSNRFRYVTIITVGNSIVNVALVCILLVSILFEQTLHGFVFLLICSYAIGFGANLSQLTFFAMINYLSQDVVSKFTVGTAVSGLFMALLRAVITAGFGADNTSRIPIIIYFIIAISVNTFDLFMNVKFCRSTVYKAKIDHFLLRRDKEKEPLAEAEEEKEEQAEKSLLELQEAEQEISSEPISAKYVNEEERIENQNYFKTLYETTFKITPYPFIIMFVFVITFTLFPGPTFARAIPGLAPTWSIIIFNIVYNIGDTVGKYSAEIKGGFNPQSLVFMFFSRLFFFFTITFMAMGLDEDDPSTNNVFFPYLNQLLFAFTNGFCISKAPSLSQTPPSSWPSRSAPSSTRSTPACSADSSSNSASSSAPSSKSPTPTPSASTDNLTWLIAHPPWLRAKNIQTSFASTAPSHSFVSAFSSRLTTSRLLPKV
jgi:hypothetical protein